MRARHLPLSLALLCACASDAEPPRTSTVSIAVPRGVAKESIVWEPRARVLAARRTPFGIDLELRAGEGAVRVTAPGACPLELSEARSAALEPLFTIEGGRAQLGFDAPFELVAKPRCREAESGRIEWRQLSGPKLSLTGSENGFVLRGKTPALPAKLPRGIVPLSPRTAAQSELEAVWRAGDREARRVVRIAAAARSSGLPSVAPGQRVLLGGAGWRVRERPRGSKAEVTPHAGALSLSPDALGRWLLTDADDHELSIAVGTHADASLDCGRSDCHASAARHAVRTPMTTVFARGLAGELADWDPSCVAGCHTVGEPGLDDGGFSDVHEALGLPALPKPGPHAYAELPSPLRRLSGVTCTSCHGPGAIPEPSASWAILRSDVCAVCHDAPPRYRHVADWAASAMARADTHEGTSAPECRRCHTTAGFLAHAGVRPERTVPEGVAMGIACAACHAPHAAEHGPKLTRRPALPEGLSLPASAEPGRVCIGCHAEPTVASAATLLFGGEKPHAHSAIAGGCVGCHGPNHTFAVDRARCASCHPTGVKTPDVAARARALFVRAFGSEPPATPHAKRLRAKNRAEQLILTVVEDRAAASHNASHASALLDEAERLLAKR